MTGDTKSMAAILANQYSKVFSTPKEMDTSFPCQQESTKTTPKLCFTIDKIVSAIDELVNASAPGADGFLLSF